MNKQYSELDQRAGNKMKYDVDDKMKCNVNKRAGDELKYDVDM